MIEQYTNDARPAVRWWWFANAITTDEIDTQLEWIASQGFGRVEIAWVYPTRPDAPPVRFLGEEWSSLVAHAAAGCAARGLGCDFTMGTIWPFGGSFVPPEYASRTWRGPSKQRLRRSWEQAYEGPTPVLDHLNEAALIDYARRITSALDGAIRAARTPALFTDSWEVDPDGLWAADLPDLFRERYGYEIEPFMESLDAQPARRYDYRELLSDLVLDRFFRPLSRLCHDAGALARVQAHGAPTDLIDAYALADVPESETMLFDPSFSAIAASAAAQKGTALVSCETFTCLYGWKGLPDSSPHLGEELLGDLKLVADAGFANGVNLVVWHGMPFTSSVPGDRFYATTHVAPDAAFAAELPAFNTYLRRTSALLREGETLARVAVYLPTEEAWMLGELPPERRRPSARWHWEMHYVEPPAALRGHAPLWTNATRLAGARVEASVSGAPVIRLGATVVDVLVVDTAWLPYEALVHLERITTEGGRVAVCRVPEEPGTRRSAGYDAVRDRLLESCGGTTDPTSDDLVRGVAPLVRRLDGEGGDVPPFWVRRLRDEGDGRAAKETWRYFFAHPACRSLAYPLPYGVSRSVSEERVRVELAGPGGSAAHELVFDACASIVLDVEADGVRDVTPSHPPLPTR